MRLFVDIAIVLSIVTAGFIAALHGVPICLVLPVVAIVAAIGVSINEEGGDDESST